LKKFFVIRDTSFQQCPEKSLITLSPSFILGYAQPTFFLEEIEENYLAQQFLGEIGSVN